MYSADSKASPCPMVGQYFNMEKKGYVVATGVGSSLLTVHVREISPPATRIDFRFEW